MIINFANLGGGGGGGYVLPVASASRLGGVKIGDGINIDSAGTISVSGGSDATKLEAVSSLPASAENGTVMALKDVEVNVNGETMVIGEVAYVPYFTDGSIYFTLGVFNGCEIRVANGDLNGDGWIPYGSWSGDGSEMIWSAGGGTVLTVSKSQDGTKFVIERGSSLGDNPLSINNESATTLVNRVYQYSDVLGWELKGEYVLPEASAAVLGGVKVGDNVNVSAGTISVPVASSLTKGVIRIGEGLAINNLGVASVTGAKKVLAVNERPANGGIGSIVSEYQAAGIGWQTFDASDEPTWARIAYANDGQYMMHFDNDNKFYGIQVQGGVASDAFGNLTTVTAGSEWLYNQDGIQISVYWDGQYVIGHITSGNTYFSMLDAYGVGGGNEEGVAVSQVGPNPLYAVDEQDVIVWTAWDGTNPYGWTHIRFNKTDGQYFCYGWLDGTDFWVDWDATNQQYGGDNFNGWTITEVSGNSFTATRGSHTAVAVDDGTKITISFDSAVEDSWGGSPNNAERGDDSKQSTYENLVTSASVTKLWSGTQAQYDALVSGGLIDNSTFYIIKANS